MQNTECTMHVARFDARKNAGRTRGEYGAYIEAVYVVVSVDHYDTCSGCFEPGDVVTFDPDFGWISVEGAEKADARRFAEKVREAHEPPAPYYF